MWARRLQLYWFPAASTLAVVMAALLLDLPPRGALARTGHGFQLGRFDTTAFLAWSVVVLAVVWAAQAVTDRPRRPSPLSHLAYYAASGVLYADLLFLAGGHDRTASEAGVPPWPLVGLAPVVWLGNHAAAKLEDARARLEGEWDAGPVRRPSLSLGGTESALWIGRRLPAGHPWVWWLAASVVAGSLTLMSRSPGGFGPEELPVLLFQGGMLGYGLVTATAEVTVTESAVRVAGGPFRVPLWTIPLGDLVEARVEDVRPRHYGGYGYRAKGGRRCLIVRAGDALVLRRRGGRDVLVTVDGADEGAALLNGLVARNVASAERSPAISRR